MSTQRSVLSVRYLAVGALVCELMFLCARVYACVSALSTLYAMAEGFCNYTSCLWVTEPPWAVVSVYAWLRPRLPIAPAVQLSGQEVRNLYCVFNVVWNPVHHFQVINTVLQLLAGISRVWWQLLIFCNLWMISTLTDSWEQTALQLFLRTVAVVCVKYMQVIPVYQTEFN